MSTQSRASEANRLAGVEQHFSEFRRWDTVADAPGLPVRHHSEVRERVAAGQYTIGIKLHEAWPILWAIGGRQFTIRTKLLGSGPVITVLLSVTIAAVRADALLLLGAPLGYVAAFAANPLQQAAKVMTLFAIGLTALLAFSTSELAESWPWLIGLFLLPFWMTRAFDYKCRSKLISSALESEIFFVILYQGGFLGILERSTGRHFWNHHIVEYERRGTSTA